MSWLEPRAEEPTHDEFVTTWLRKKTVSKVSEALAELGYVNMTPLECLRWFRRLKAVGVRLEEKPHCKRKTPYAWSPSELN